MFETLEHILAAKGPSAKAVVWAHNSHIGDARFTDMGAARGELIYFLDDDSTPPPENLRHAVSAFKDPQVKMLGGPNLCPPDAPFIEQVFALVHASWLAFFSSRARYASVGKTRVSGEKELILCNLIARRDAMPHASKEIAANTRITTAKLKGSRSLTPYI